MPVLLAVRVEVSLSSDWTPLRWPCGPLDLEQSKDIQAVKEALTAWLDPKALSFLEGGPVNAILVSWAGGTATDAKQQAALQPVIAEAKKRNIAVLGRVTGEAPNAAKAAAAAGLSAIVTDTVVPSVGGLKVIPAVTPQQAAGIGSPLMALTKSTWPRIPTQWRARDGKRGDSGGATGGGPTGAPWVESSGWICSLATAKAPGKKFWLLSEPPEDVIGYRPATYQLAVADAAAYGAHWVVAFDADTRKALASGGAKDTWKAVADAKQFFAARKACLQRPEIARLGILSDFDGPNEFIAEEMLNLTPRRAVPYRIMDLPKFKPTSLSGLKAVVWIDEKEPSGSARSALTAFVADGGVLIAPASSAGLVSGKPASNFEGRFNVYNLGKGKVAIASEPWSDPWVLCADTHLLLSRKHDMVRTFNAGSCNVRFTGTPGKGYLHVLSFTARTFGYPASFYVAQPYKTARWSTLDSVQDQPIEIKPKGPGVEVHLPDFGPYALVEFGA
ncbi:MAG TPA: hypothetical protein VER03_20250 [Bryobacteraceae bacterium]|nr:hypothetical protein [Bryobacteraceae bacterium]